MQANSSSPRDAVENTPLISEVLAAFVNGHGDRDIPPHIAQRAKLLMLDAIGIALASSMHDFAATAVRAMRALSGGDAGVSMIAPASRNTCIRSSRARRWVEA